MYITLRTLSEVYSYSDVCIHSIGIFAVNDLVPMQMF